MNEVLTRAEMEEQFQGEWLLIADPEVNEDLEVLRGRVVRHSPERDEVYQAGVEFRLKHTASLYVGPPSEHVWLNEWKYLLTSDELSWRPPSFTREKT